MGVVRNWPLDLWQQNATFHKCYETQTKMTGGTPEVRSDKILTLLTFDI